MTGTTHAIAEGEIGAAAQLAAEDDVAASHHETSLRDKDARRAAALVAAAALHRVLALLVAVQRLDVHEVLRLARVVERLGLRLRLARARLRRGPGAELNSICPPGAEHNSLSAVRVSGASLLWAQARGVGYDPHVSDVLR